MVMARFLCMGHHVYNEVWIGGLASHWENQLYDHYAVVKDVL